jgi:hypothetical protein
MKTTLLISLAALLLSGCERPGITGPDEVRAATRVVQVMVIDGFGDVSGLLTSSSLVRVGTYFDFRPYDSLAIIFKAERLSTESPFDEILVRVGPTFCLRDSLYAVENNLSRRVNIHSVSKSQFCALSFLTIDSRALLRLSDLKVVGWMTR